MVMGLSCCKLGKKHIMIQLLQSQMNMKKVKGRIIWNLLIGGEFDSACFLDLFYSFFFLFSVCLSSIDIMVL